MDSNYLVCDYVFPDENDSDICERIKELFNYDVTDPQNQLVFVEDLPRNLYFDKLIQLNPFKLIILEILNKS